MTRPTALRLLCALWLSAAPAARVFAQDASPAVTKSGGGSLVLEGSGTYSGSTTVDAGTLTLHGIVPPPEAPSELPPPVGVHPPAARPPAEIRRQADALIRELPKATPARRTAIEGELAKLGTPAQIALKVAANADDLDLRQAAAASAVRVRWRAACGDAFFTQHPGLLGAMQGDGPARLGAVADLAGGKDEKLLAPCIPFFAECLADASVAVRQAAVDGLIAVAGTGAQGEPAKVALRSVALDGGDPAAQMLAIAGLGKIRAMDGATMALLMETENGEVRRTALQAAGHSQVADCIPQMAQAARDPDWRVRAAAMQALELLCREHGNGANLPAREKAGAAGMAGTRDSESFVRVLAAKVAVEAGAPGAGDRVLAMWKAGQMEESDALPLLSQARHPEALRLIASALRGADAGKAQLAMEWIRPYVGKDAAADALLDAVLKDESKRALWPEAVKTIASGFDYNSDRNGHRRFSKFLPLLFAADQATAQAAMEQIGGQLGENPLPADQLARLKSLPGAWRRRMVLVLEDRLWRRQGNNLPRRPEGEAHSPALAALDLADAQTAADALAMIAADRMGDDFGASEEEVLSYLRYDRFRASDNPVYVDGVPARPQPPVFPPPLLSALRGALASPDAQVATRAAAILYHAKADRGAKVADVLKKALASRGAELVPALAALVEEPGPLADALDFPALWGDPAADARAKERALRVAAADGRAPWRPLVLAAAGNVTLNYDEDGRMLLAAVLRMGEPGMKLVADKWLAAQESYYAENFIQSAEVRALPTAMKLDFAARVLAAMEKEAGPKTEKTPKQAGIFQNDNRVDGLLDMLLATDDAKALPLILSAQKLSGQRSEWKKEQVEQFVLAHDPAAQKKFWAEFALDPAQKLADYQTINRIVRFPATPENTDRVRAALRAAAKPGVKADGRDACGQFWTWFPPDVQAQVTAELDRYPDSIRRLALDAAFAAPDAALGKWLSIPARAEDWDPAVPRAAWWIANGEEVSLEGRTPAQLALLLPAQALRPDAPQRLAPFAKHKDSAVVAACARGLALHALFTGTDPGPFAHEAWGRVFHRRNIHYATLCAEAFLKVNPAAFAALPDDALGATAGPTVRAFRFCAKLSAGQKPAEQDRDLAALRQCAAENLDAFWPFILSCGEVETLKVLDPAQLAACPDRARLAQLGMEAKDAGLISNLVLAGVLRRETPGFGDAAAKSLAKAQGALADPQRMALFKAGCDVARTPEALAGLLQTAVLTQDAQAQLAVADRARTMGAPAQAALRAVRDERARYALPFAMGSAAVIHAAFPDEAKDREALAHMLEKVDVSGQQYDQRHPAFMGAVSMALHAASPAQRKAFAKRLEGVRIENDYQGSQRMGQLLPLLAWEDMALATQVRLALVEKHPGAYGQYNEWHLLGVLALRGLPADVSGFGNANASSSGRGHDRLYNAMKRAQAEGFGPPSEELRAAFGSVASVAPDAPADAAVVEDDGADAEGSGDAGEDGGEGDIQAQVQAAGPSAASQDKRSLPELQAAAAAAKEPQERARLGALAVLKGGAPNAELKLARGVLMLRGKLPGEKDEEIFVDRRVYRHGRVFQGRGAVPPADNAWQAMLDAAAKTESPGPAVWAAAAQPENVFEEDGRGDGFVAKRLDLPGLVASPLAPIQLTPPGAEFLGLPGLPKAPFASFDPLVGLEAQEEWAVQAAFVSLAPQAQNPSDLRDKWQAWWKVHAGEGRDAWWRLAVAQSAADLSHRDWWWRMRAAVRLESLTGRRVNMPAPFKMEDWAKLRQQWEAWLGTPQAATPLAVLLAQAKLPAPPPDLTPEKRLDLLAGLAESKDPLLAAAARWQLAVLSGPQKKELAERWKKSDSPPLRKWANQP